MKRKPTAAELKIWAQWPGLTLAEALANEAWLRAFWC